MDTPPTSEGYHTIQTDSDTNGSNSLQSGQGWREYERAIEDMENNPPQRDQLHHPPELQRVDMQPSQPDNTDGGDNVGRRDAPLRDVPANEPARSPNSDDQQPVPPDEDQASPDIRSR